MDETTDIIPTDDDTLNCDILVPNASNETTPYNYRISLEDILHCTKVLKLTPAQTAERLGCTRSNIIQRLKAAGYHNTDLNNFKRYRADVHALRGLMISKNLTEDKIKKMSAYQLQGMLAINEELEKKARDEQPPDFDWYLSSQEEAEIDAELEKVESELSN